MTRKLQWDSQHGINARTQFVLGVGGREVRLTNAVSNLVHELLSVVYVHAVSVQKVSFYQFEGSRNKAVATKLLVL
jgi:hypothetical protein